jgi:hypothetical protein
MDAAALADARNATSSQLLAKARRIGLSLPLDLERLAIARGCTYYERDLAPRNPPLGDVPLKNEEIAIALLSPSLKPSAREIRLAAALLGAPETRPDEVVALSRQENCSNVVRYIALCGQQFEPNNPFWIALLDQLPSMEIDRDKFPHPSRFVETTGIDRGRVGMFTRWIRPRLPTE